MEDETMTRFEIGETYATRAMCDWDCIYDFTILARTAKSVTVKVRGQERRRGLKIKDGVETFKPFGTHSMCAVISADKLLADVEKQR
jgi:hypothetical protein